MCMRWFSTAECRFQEKASWAIRFLNSTRRSPLLDALLPRLSACQTLCLTRRSACQTLCYIVLSILCAQRNLCQSDCCHTAVSENHPKLTIDYRFSTLFDMSFGNWPTVRSWTSQGAVRKFESDFPAQMFRVFFCLFSCTVQSARAC